MPVKIIRCIRSNVGTEESPVYELRPESGEAPSPVIIAPEDHPVIGEDGLPELWYWAE